MAFTHEVTRLPRYGTRPHVLSTFVDQIAKTIPNVSLRSSSTRFRNKSAMFGSLLITTGGLCLVCSSAVLWPWCHLAAIDYRLHVLIFTIDVKSDAPLHTAAQASSPKPGVETVARENDVRKQTKPAIRFSPQRKPSHHSNHLSREAGRIPRRKIARVSTLPHSLSVRTASPSNYYCTPKFCCSTRTFNEHTKPDSGQAESNGFAPPSTLLNERIQAVAGADVPTH